MTTSKGGLIVALLSESLLYLPAALLLHRLCFLSWKKSLKATATFQDDPDLITEFIKYPGETGEIRGFLAWPKTGKKFPAVIIIHENRGLQPHIQDVTRRMAKEGFLALAPDALSPLGGTLIMIR